MNAMVSMNRHLELLFPAGILLWSYFKMGQDLIPTSKLTTNEKLTMLKFIK